MAYSKTNWQDLPNTTTPINATRLNNIETGIENNDKRLNGTSPAGEMIVDSIRTKNIFDGILEEGGYTNQGNKDTYTGTYRNANKVSVKPNTTYTTSINGTAQQYVMFYYDSTGTFLSNADNRTGTFTTPANCYYVNFRCYSADYRSDFKTLKVQVEEGSEATNYMPYGRLFNSGSDIIMAGATSTTTLNGNTDLDYSVTLNTPSGYQALGLIGYYIHGAYSTRVAISGAYLYNSTTARFIGRNMGNDTATLAIDVFVLYIKM